MKVEFDKYYTNENISKLCVEKTFEICKNEQFDIILEPSAGNGSFKKQLDNYNKNVLAMDIKPEELSIIKQDFFTYEYDNTKRYLTIGNPPFGVGCSLAVKFFNYSAKFSNVIAFIIPKTFRRQSIQNKLNTDFELIFDMDIPENPCSFTPKMSVKCCFQIWKKYENGKKRNHIILDKKHIHFEFLKYGEKDDNNQPTPPKNADFALKAYGSNCGEIKKDNLQILRPKSWHWIKNTNVISLETLIENFNKIDYNISKNSARQDSLGQKDLIYLYTQTNCSLHS